MKRKTAELPKVSIVIPVYNGSNYLKEAIDSALNQTYPNVEVLVVNDGSDDDGATERIALSYGEQIRYFYKENGGVSSALNLGIKNMSGEYFAWLSHDDAYYQEKIEKELEAVLESGDKTKIVHCEYEFYNMDTQERTPTDFHLYYEKEKLINSVFPVLQLQIHACSALIHKSNFERVGLFREDIRTVQDIEMWFRLLKDQRSIFINDVLMMVREHASAGSKTESNYKQETCKIYKRLVKQMSKDMRVQVFGSEWSFLVRMGGFLKSYGDNIEDLEKEIALTKPSLSDKNNIQVLKKKGNLNATKVYIFGAGQYGIRMHYELKKRDIETAGFIDNNPALQGKEIDGLRCFRIIDVPVESSWIIVAVRNGSRIMQQLKNMGYHKVSTRQEIDGFLAK